MHLCLFSVVIFLLFGNIYGTNPPTIFKADGKYEVTIDSDVHISFTTKNGKSLKTRHASSMYKTDGSFKRCVTGSDELDLCVQLGDFKVNVTLINNNCMQIESSQPAKDLDEISACFEYSDAQWFGGAERWYQNWPVQSVNVDNKPFLTGYDSSQSVAEPFWFNSNGASIRVDDAVPLFVDSNQRTPGELCLIAKVAEPYVKRNVTLLRYEVCAAENAVEVQRIAVDRYFGTPSGRPDDAMFAEPIYSTWVKYGRNINQETLNSLVGEIKDHTFPIGQIEIDDTWEPCYGASDFDEKRFPNISEFTTSVHNLGGRVTAWIYPFINQNCNPAFDDALKNNRFVTDESGNTTITWWCGVGGAIDFTNPTSSQWWVDRTKALLNKSGLDSFKFDAGETSYLPKTPQLNTAPELIPNEYVRKYVEAASNFKGVMEVRVGRNTQRQPVFVRMLDKDSRFGLDNGLQSVITTLFQMNLAGYPFVLPDMVGGNAYGDKITKELFIRWLQATTFMPSIQFSVLPWDFDLETVEISRRYLALHSTYAPLLQAAADKAVQDGTPINTPIWWIAPNDENALKCRDEYLLGENILVAPILEAGAVSRDIYLPDGTWFNLEIGQTDGPVWLRDFPAPLDTLPYFVRVLNKN